MQTISQAGRAVVQDVRRGQMHDWMPLEVQARHRVGLASRWVMLAVLALVLGGVIAWAALSQIPEITRGEGKVISRTQKQVIQSLEGGLLHKLYVQEGDVVEAGQTVVDIDPTKASALYDEVASKARSLQAAQYRLQAEAYGTELTFPKEFAAANPELVAQETKAYQVRRKNLDDAVELLMRNRGLSEKELAMLKPMAAKGAVSVVEVLRMERQANELSLQAEAKKNAYRADASTELLKVNADLQQFEAQGKARKDLLERASIRSPVKGVVTRVYDHTIGGVIQPGGSIMDISPLDDQLIIESKVRPQDVAFLRSGLPVTVKITAYDYSKYGGLHGEVIHISPDTFEDSNARNAAEAQPYYHVLVRTERNYLIKDGKHLPIIPGMVATAEIETGKKSILEFVFKPLHQLGSPFTER
jgi:adhesin transport system membrane fusion protein